MSGSPFEHLHTDRCIRPGVADHTNTQASEEAFCIAPGLVVHLDRVSLCVDEERLLTRERRLHRPVEQPSSQCGLALVRHVLFPAERAAVGDEFGDDGARFHVEDAGDVVAIVPDALATGVDVEATIV